LFFETLFAKDMVLDGEIGASAADLVVLSLFISMMSALDCLRKMLSTTSLPLDR
jgi:hypothetical protein